MSLFWILSTLLIHAYYLGHQSPTSTNALVMNYFICNRGECKRVEEVDY